MLVCEFVTKGDLHTFLEKYKEKGHTLNESDALYYALQVSESQYIFPSHKAM